MVRVGLTALALLTAASGSAGCATIFASGPDVVNINSTPEGARVKLDGLRIGKTPMTATVERSSVGIVTLDLNGYEQETAQIRKSFNAVSLVNILFWPGFLVDAVTDNIQKHSTTPIFVELEPKTLAK